MRLSEEREKIIEQIKKLEERLEIINSYLEYSDYDLTFYAV